MSKNVTYFWIESYHFSFKTISTFRKEHFVPTHFFNLLPLGILQIFVNFFSLVIALWIFPQFFIVNLSICDSLKWHAVERVGYFVDWRNLHNQFTVDLKVALKWSLNLILQLATIPPQIFTLGHDLECFATRKQNELYIHKRKSRILKFFYFTGCSIQKFDSQLWALEFYMSDSRAWPSIVSFIYISVKYLRYVEYPR